MSEIIMTYLDGGENLHGLQNVGEIVRCKDCKYRGDDENCPMVFVEWIEYDDDGYIEHDDIWHDNSTDDGFCNNGKRRNV